MDYLSKLKSHARNTEKKLRCLGEPTAKTAKTPDQGSSGSSGSTPPLVSETFFSGAPPADDHADRAHPEPPTPAPIPTPAPEVERPTAATTAAASPISGIIDRRDDGTPLMRQGIPLADGTWLTESEANRRLKEASQ